ncbi:hypothetical protein llap_6680 [Limosa lapponica baueri]|uniref:Uncharacterized protein n=1 Tax=Limosa lapponica baueri TaxID=1758121 RepID=A0A2I0UAD9_LIMLA|nr:hypothetical protein llap_6680 [Limosa lapponica baueri]
MLGLKAYFHESASGFYCFLPGRTGNYKNERLSHEGEERRGEERRGEERRGEERRGEERRGEERRGEERAF